MHQAVDEVFINISYEYRVELEAIILVLEKMGILVHLNIDSYSIYVKNKTIERFTGYNIVSFATTIYNFRSVLMKRLIDVVGLLVTLLAVIFIALATKLESKGPVSFAQRSVGKNGRTFHIY